MRRLIGLCAAVALVCGVASGASTNRTWNVDSDGTWATAADWNPSGVPATGDNVILGNIITASRTLTLNAAYSLGKMTINNTNVGSFYNLTAASAYTITLTGLGTDLTIGSLGANLAPSATPGNIAFSLPNGAATWDIAGTTFVGNVNGGGAAGSLTKISAGQLTWAGSGTYSGNLTVNAGDFQLTGSPTGLGNFSMTPTGTGNMTFFGNGSLGLAASKNITFTGTGSGNVIVSPGTAAGQIARLTLGSVATNTTYFQNLSQLTEDVSGTQAASADLLRCLGPLNLGAGGTTNTLNISLASGSLSAGYLLATGTSLTGTFNTVTYNGSTVASPTSGQNVGGTSNVVYGSTYISVENPTLKPKFWLADAASGFGTSSNWSALPAFDGTESIILPNVLTAARTLTLDADRNILSLAIDGGSYVYTIDRGSASHTLTLQSGNLSVAASGANLTNTGTGSGQQAYVSLSIPNSLSATWNIGGTTYVGNVNGASAATTITKTGSGQLNWAGSGTYSGAVTVNAGSFRLTGAPTGIGNFLATPTVTGDITVDGTGTLGLASGKTARFLGNGSGNVIVSPGVAAGGMSPLRFGTTAGSNSLLFDNGSRYNADVSGTAPGMSDGLGVIGSLNLGTVGVTTNSLYINLASGSLQKGYLLADGSTGMSGKFGSVYYNGTLVGSPESANSIGGTHSLVYGSNYVLLQNSTANNLHFWANPDSGQLVTTSNWTSTPSFDCTDSYIIPYTGGTCNLPNPSGGVRYFGDMTVNGGKLYLAGTYTGTYRFMANATAGTTGSLTINDANASTALVNNSNVAVTFDMDGDFIVNPGAAVGVLSNTGGTIIMRGVGKTFEARTSTRNYNATDNVTVMPGASVYFNNAGSVSYNNIRKLDIRGTASGAATVCATQAQNIFVRGAGDTSQMDLYLDGDSQSDFSTSLIQNHWVVVTSPMISGNWRNYYFGEATYLNAADNMLETQRMTGNLRLRNMNIVGSFTSGSSSRGASFTVDTDNKSVDYNLTVDCDAIIGNTSGTTPSTVNYRGILKINTSTVKVGGNLTVKNCQAVVGGNYITATSGTLQAGSNFTVEDAASTLAAGWDMGTSTLLCDGNGTGRFQTLSTKGLPFYNVTQVD